MGPGWDADYKDMLMIVFLFFLLALALAYGDYKEKNMELPEVRITSVEKRWHEELKIEGEFGKEVWRRFQDGEWYRWGLREGGWIYFRAEGVSRLEEAYQEFKEKENGK